jgi:hypothetical protein
VPFAERKKEVDIKYYKDIKRKKRQEQTEVAAPEAAATEPVPSEAKPLSPKMGPFTVQNPKIYNKMYRWCSCGQSLNQPFCDGAHEGTKFKPLKFTI